MVIEIEPIGELHLRALLELACLETSPTEVMPPVDGPPGWTAARIAAFEAFYRSRSGASAAVHRESMLAVRVDGRVVGAVRIANIDRDTLEAGMWLARSARGHGLGAPVLRAALSAARSQHATRLVASTSTANAAAIAVLRRCGAALTCGADGRIDAVITLA